MFQPNGITITFEKVLLQNISRHNLIEVYWCSNQSWILANHEDMRTVTRDSWGKTKPNKRGSWGKTRPRQMEQEYETNWIKEFLRGNLGHLNIVPILWVRILDQWYISWAFPIFSFSNPQLIFNDAEFKIFSYVEIFAHNSFYP